LIERTIKEIREHQAAGEATKKLRQDVKAFSDILKSTGIKPQQTIPIKKEIKNKPDKSRPDVHIFKKGDLVTINGQQAQGEIIEINGSEVTLAIGNVTVKTSVNRLEKLNPGMEKIITPVPVKTAGNIIEEMHHHMANFKLTIDVRGKHIHEAITEIRTYLDDAIMLSIPEISILHGKGDGILRQGIRDYLKTIPQIKHYGDEHIERGGDGITIVRLT
jgi:DNA mismatch repair protein MutS2